MSDEETALRIYSHSTLFYWWPAWAASFVLGIWTLVAGERVPVAGGEAHILESATPGFLFMALLLLVAIVTTVRMKGIRSVVLVLAVALLTVLAAWLGFLDDIFQVVPALSTHLSAGFYLSFGGILLLVWFTVVFLFDRLVFWQISEGQLVRVRVIGMAEKAYDARGLTVEHEADDLLRHVVIGFGSGDIILRTSGAEQATVPLRNALRVNHKIDRIHHLVSIEPDD